MSSRLRTLAAAAAILAAALVAYQALLFPRDPAAIYPWSSDNWGHLIKAEYLRAQIAEGHYYPDLFPAWYSGQQMLRYYAPLPYYILVGLFMGTGNIWIAGNILIFLTALVGAWGFLLFKKWIGLGFATVAGMLFLILPDNLRVAFAEGNLPRIIATALLPIVFYFLLNMVTEGGRRRDFVGVVVTMSLIVLAHAMMAGIFALGLGLFAVVYWLVARTSPQVTGRAVLALIVGMMASGWWLLPSLTGGITELDQAAASEAIATFPANVVFNPTIRGHDPEIFYGSIALFLIPFVTLSMWKHAAPWLKTLFIVSLFMGLIASTLANDIWKAIPFNNLFWPLRFMSFAGFSLLLLDVALVRLAFRKLAARAGRAGRLYRFATVGLLLAVFLDFQPSLALVHGRDRPEDVVAVAERLRALKGWRVAAADLSRLGSAPAQLFTTVGGREQVFGWAYQGSITAPLIARINQAMVQDHVQYAVNRFERLGADDIVVLSLPEIGPAFAKGLQEDGYRVVQTTPNLRLFHKDGQPRGTLVELSMFGIGGGANNLALLFPEMLVGSSTNIDDYDLDFLLNFDTLVLSRFSFKSQKKAEKIVTDYAATGRKVIVDLTGAPLDALSREPKFLGVYGEPIVGISQGRLIIDGVVTPLLPFTEEYGPWRSVTPQGVDEVLIPFEYAAAEGTLLGRSHYGKGSVDFLGLNLIFHATVTRDPLAIRLLEAELGRPAFQLPRDRPVVFEGYAADQSGYRFGVSLEQDSWVLLPMGYHAGTVVLVDGKPADTVSVETLALTRFPAGSHAVEIRSEETKVYLLGRMATGIGVAILAAYVLGLIPKPAPRRPASKPAGEAARPPRGEVAHA